MCVYVYVNIMITLFLACLATSLVCGLTCGERKCRELCAISEHAEKMDFATSCSVPNAPTKGERTLGGGEELARLLASEHVQVKLMGVKPEHAAYAAIALEIKPPDGPVFYQLQQCCSVTPRRRWHLLYGSSMLMATGVWLIFGGGEGRGLLIAGVAICAVALVLLAASLALFCRAPGWSHTCSTTSSRGTSPPHSTSASSSTLSSTQSLRPSQHDSNWHKTHFRHWRSSSLGAPDEDESSVATKPRMSPGPVSPIPFYEHENAAQQPPVLGQATPRRGIAVAPKYRPSSIRPQRVQERGDYSVGLRISAALSRKSRDGDEAQAAGWRLGTSRGDDAQDSTRERVTVVSRCKRARTDECISVEGSISSLA